MLGPVAQEVIALSLVALALASILLGLYRRSLAAPIAQWLLKNGKVGLAMRVRAQMAAQGGCGSCGDGSGPSCSSDPRRERITRAKG